MTFSDNGTKSETLLATLCHDIHTDGPTPVAASDLGPGDLVAGRYEVMERLGYGSHGTTYRVFDIKASREKVLKVFDEVIKEDEAAMALIKETVRRASINHPNIVRTGEVREGELAAMERELLPGHSLAQVIRESPDGRLNEGLAIHIARQMAQGLAYAHGADVLHLDLKPSNVILTGDGSAVLTDFGVTGALWASAMPQHLGPRRHMAPEVIHGMGVGKAADIYAFGAILYEMLTGKPPVTAENVAVETLTRRPDPISGVSKGLSRLVMRCLEKRAEDRFRGFDEVLVALETILSAKDGGDLKDSRKRVSPYLSAMVLLTLSTLTSLGFWMHWYRSLL